MSTGNHKKKSNYIVQGGILAAASILVRIIGMVYRIPVTRIHGAADFFFQSPTGSIEISVCANGSWTGKGGI